MPLARDIQPKFEEVVRALADECKSIHTGKAHAGLVEDIKVNHYNTLMPLKQVATIAIAGPQDVTIRPWDAGALQPIETALREAGRNLNPVNDGSMIRIKLPPMSGERREELMKLVSRQAEQARIGLRTIREQVWRQVKQDEKNGTLTQDDRYRIEEELNDLIGDYNEKIERLVTEKQQSITA